MAIEPYPDTGGIGFTAHFFPGGKVRLYAGESRYGPPTSDTRYDQTPPLTEVSPYIDWRSLGIARAQAKFGDYENRSKERIQADAQKLAQWEKTVQEIYAFEDRLWKQRGYSEEQQKKKREELLYLQSEYYAIALARLLQITLEAQGLNEEQVEQARKGWEDWNVATLEARLTQEIAKLPPEKRPTK